MIKEIIKDKNVKNTFIALASVGAISFSSSFLNVRSICIIHIVTGIPCPACGMGRAYGRLFNLDLAGAFMYHPLFFSVPFIPLLMYKKIPEKTSLILNISFLILFIAVWIIRMIMLFPNTYPMNYNYNSLFEIIIYFLF